MKIWLMAAYLGLGLSMGAHSDSNPLEVVEPLRIARDSFYLDVSKFHAGAMTERELTARVSEQMIPLINSKKVALRVMGHHRRNSSEADQNLFVKVMQETLIDAYSKGLGGYEGEKLILPLRAKFLRPGMAFVEAELERPGKESIPVQFALGFDDTRGWLVENVTVAGINLGLLLRDQFNALVSSTGSVSSAIDSWSFTSVGGN